MALSFRNFVGNTTLGSAAATLWTCTGSASAQDIIRAFTLVNFTSSAQTYSIFKVPSGGTAVSTNVVAGGTLSGQTSMVVKELLNQVLGVGDTIQAQAGLSASIAVNAGGMRSI